ncbi:hypothetical protein JCM10207_003982 [Rhodosporidiobolus poonsookiae]
MSAPVAPASMKALVLVKTDGDFKPGPHLWHPVEITDVPVPTPKDGEVLVKVLSAGFNHRDVFQRQSLYPGTIFHSPPSPSILGADCVGLVLSPPSHPLYQQRVLVSPVVGWRASPLGPDVPGEPFGILGSVKQTQGRGTFAEFVKVGEDDVVKCPEHLSREQAAALPLGGLTAYRAVFTKAGVKKGDNVLITGIGGGVAILALQFAAAAGANVWVSSSSEEKIKRAVSLGAKGGVNYKDDSWPKQLASLLPPSRPFLDAVVDSGGGPLGNQLARLLKDGAIISCYGQTSGKPIEVGMAMVLKNAELRGSTMGSREEFKRAVEFVKEHRVEVVVDTVLEGMDKAEDGFQLLKKGGQFGKVVLTIAKDEQPKL